MKNMSIVKEVHLIKVYLDFKKSNFGLEYFEKENFGLEDLLK